MVFKSKYPDIECPTDLTVWEWAFESPRFSPLHRYPRDQIAGFTNAFTGERLDFFQVKEHATHLCTALTHKYGLREGETVSLFGGNSVWYAVALYAVLRAGGRVNGASPAYTADEMASALKTARTKYIMTVPDSIDVAVKAAREAGIPTKHIFLLEGRLGGYISMDNLLSLGRSYESDGQSAYYRIPEGGSNDVCGYLNFSSGTTGLPKAVMLSHKNVIAQCLQLETVAFPEKKRFLANLPLFHISGLVRFLHLPLAGNDECIMLPTFTITNFLIAIQKYRITDLQLVPAIIIRLINDPIVKAYDLTSVKRIGCGAAPVGAQVIARLQKSMPWTGFRQSYGMTETCCALTINPPELGTYAYADNGGMVLASNVLKIVDVETGRELGTNETGEILAQGPTIAMGYLDNERETAETFGADGFLRTGDIGSIDSHGFIRIVDRIKEMIKVKGHQVAPAELEHLLLSHPDVEDCAVLGIPDEYSAERPKAYIVLRKGVRAGDEVGQKLIGFVKERRVRYKWVKEIEFLGEIPKSSSGKMLRRVLREREKGNGERGVVVRDEAWQARL